MFSFHKSVNWLYKAQWYFDDKMLDDLEYKLQVTFEKKSNYYLISQINYTFLDLVKGLKNMFFTIEKLDNICKIQILSA